MDKQGREEFGRYITEMREKHNVGMDKLCEGVCSLSMLGRFESGERFPDKLTRDRLFARMGENADSYENYLDFDEYNRWKLRQQILQAVVNPDKKKAKLLLERYQKENGMRKALERQFVLAIETMLLKRETGMAETVAKNYENAVKLTIPRIEKISLKQLKLSMQELYLITEYVNYNKVSQEKQQWLEGILDYISQSPLNSVCRAKVYPQTVYYLCREWEQEMEENPEVSGKMLQLCGKAMEILREAGGSYYLWEILQMQKKILGRMIKNLQERGQQKKAEALKTLEKENGEYLWALKETCAEFGRPVEMQNECYLFVEKESYCIGDVIRIRRKMLGLSREQLCEGICSLKTIGRIENNKLSTQRPIVRELFKRLHLPMEFQRSELITSDFEAKRLMDELSWSINERESDKVEQILLKLKEKVSMDIPLNRQSIERIGVLNAKHKGKITKEEFIMRMKEVLAYTLSYEEVFSAAELYMTDEEISCVYNIACIMKWKDRELQKYIEVLQAYFMECEREKCIGAYINMYEFIMTGVANQLGNKGEYERSDEISRIIVSESLKWNRLNVVTSGIYNLTWNYEQRKKEHIPVSKERDVLRNLRLCIVYSRFRKSKFKEQEYREKLKQRGLMD